MFSAQTLPTGVQRIGANLSPLAKIDGLDERINADIAILDTGIAPHPDLNIFTNVSFIAGQTTDGNGHGTHVAGIAAAIDNGVGVVGVAPGARLWAIKVMDNTGAGTTGSVIQGIDFVTQNAGQIEEASDTVPRCVWRSATPWRRVSSLWSQRVMTDAMFMVPTAFKTRRMIRFPPRIPKS